MLDERVLARHYPFAAILNEDGSWHITFPDLPGLMTEAETWEDIGSSAQTALRLWLRTELEDGHPIPLPTIGRRAGEDAWRGSLTLSSAELNDVPRLTSREVAAELGITPRRVTALARQRGVGRLVGRDLLFSADDVDVLRPRQPGRPRQLATA